MNVLIVPEDYTKDRYVLKPIIERMFAEIGKGQARIKVFTDQRLGGIDQATRWERIADIIDLHPTFHVFLLIVDRDGEAGRRQQLDRLKPALGKFWDKGESCWRKMPGKKWKYGPWLDRTCQKTGLGQPFDRKSIPRRLTLTPMSLSEALPKSPVKDG